MTQNIKKIISAMGGLYDKKLTSEMVALLMADLSIYSENQILEALKKCRSELNFFPSVAQIKERINIGHLSPNEAWAKMPFYEGQSVCWTDEMKTAFFVAEPLLSEGDKIGARVAFLEKYKELLNDVRGRNQRAKYSLSLGYDKLGRDAVVREAVHKKYISHERARPYLIENIEPHEKIKKITNQCIKTI